MPERTDCYFPHPDGKHAFSTEKNFAALRIYTPDGKEVPGKEIIICANDAAALLLYAAFADRFLHLFDGQFNFDLLKKTEGEA